MKKKIYIIIGIISILCIILSYEYPFFPVQLSLISIICVGFPSLCLALEPNYNKVQKGFLVKVFRNALPSGLCVFINIFFLISISYLFKIDFDYFRLVIVAVTGYLNLRLLYKVSLPLSLSRKLLLFLCFILFYTCLLVFHKFFLIKTYNLLSFALIFLLILSNNYIVCFFEEIYDKIVLRIRKRGRVVNEKK